MTVSAKIALSRSMSNMSCLMVWRASSMRPQSLSLRLTRRKAEVKPKVPCQYARGAARSTFGKEKTWSRDCSMI